ncbi:pirin family protein [Noviherbaspirillum denitrificans]|uniref:Quercetin 2,3-dioxygenase n=1 Tax=Noviherbaspirillum denitrificans TaxID=1968433 RepID=A0A254TBM5_9BURK|nr:pirin family protein [Noviherbaspirillum denitrificans]OWW19557.1 quercetin 2,3-dioxygenase [Noviherbaspirillum denitrificans]
MTTVTTRTLQRVIEGLATSDGAGVKLRRSLGQGQGSRLDPFLMLDEFSSDNPGDYIAGFPPHPHRGFETVTYMLDGHMRHEDHLGNVGELKNGGVQWMTAGRGIVHSEMPQQEEGRMRGFQLWINLPAKEKMKPAGYRDIPPAEIPVADLPGGGTAKVIAGTLNIDGKEVAGPIQGLSTEPLYVDVVLPAGAAFSHALDSHLNAFIYVYEGSVKIGDAAPRPLKSQSAGFLSPGDQVDVRADEGGARFLLLAGRPLKEPVTQYGPFVMNTVEEIEQAITDFQSGKFTQAPA